MLLLVSLAAVIARLYLRLIRLKSWPDLSDYFVLAGWILCLGWVISTTVALVLGFDSLVSGDETAVLSVGAKKV